MPQEYAWNYRQLERLRWLVGLSAVLGVLALVVIGTAFVSSFIWPRTDLGESAALIRAGRVTDFAVNEPVFFQEGTARLWLVRQPDDSFVAFSARDPYRGCTVPWRPNFSFNDPRTG